jgi:hypothetical protein
MRLSVRISPVEPSMYKLPERCPWRNDEKPPTQTKHWRLSCGESWVALRLSLQRRALKVD